VTLLEVYVVVGLPLIALAMAGGALWLTTRSLHRLDRRPGAAE
jgi:hypothetical protein